MKKIKLVIGTNDFIIGGVQQLALDILARLDRNRFDIYLITLIKFPDTKATFYDRVPSDVKVIRHDFRRFTNVREWFRLARTLREIRPDVVDTSLFFSNTIFTMLKPFFGYAIITGEHNSGDAKPFLMRLADLVLAPLKFRIVADSKIVAAFVSETEHISMNRFTVIYNGVDLKTIEKERKEYANRRDAIRAELGVGPREFVFLNVARMVKQKRQELAIDGFRLFNEKHPGYRLVLVGDGPRMGAIKEKIRNYDLESQIVLAGESKEVHRFYAIADAFLLTSQREGFCIAGMEGLAFGLPLISTKVGGVMEYLKEGENGYFISAFTPEAVADAMGKIVSSDLARMSKNATESAKPYSSERAAAAYEKLFLSSIGQ
ncbi:MAG: glycosyltransferase family 4 protein [bacterium]|nr:glycosyltransferase family 4 protein [bacterium]